MAVGFSFIPNGAWEDLWEGLLWQPKLCFMCFFTILFFNRMKNKVIFGVSGDKSKMPKALKLTFPKCPSVNQCVLTQIWEWRRHQAYILQAWLKSTFWRPREVSRTRQMHCFKLVTINSALPIPPRLHFTIALSDGWAWDNCREARGEGEYVFKQKVKKENIPFRELGGLNHCCNRFCKELTPQSPTLDFWPDSGWVTWLRMSVHLTLPLSNATPHLFSGSSSSSGVCSLTVMLGSEASPTLSFCSRPCSHLCIQGGRKLSVEELISQSLRHLLEAVLLLAEEAGAERRAGTYTRWGSKCFQRGI